MYDKCIIDRIPRDHKIFIVIPLNNIKFNKNILFILVR